MSRTTRRGPVHWPTGRRAAGRAAHQIAPPPRSTTTRPSDGRPLHRQPAHQPPGRAGERRRPILTRERHAAAAASPSRSACRRGARSRWRCGPSGCGPTGGTGLPRAVRRLEFLGSDVLVYCDCESSLRRRARGGAGRAIARRRDRPRRGAERWPPTRPISCSSTPRGARLRAPERAPCLRPESSPVQLSPTALVPAPVPAGPAAPPRRPRRRLYRPWHAPAAGPARPIPRRARKSHRRNRPRRARRCVLFLLFVIARRSRSWCSASRLRTRYSGFRWVGFDNYRDLVERPAFRGSVANTALSTRDRDARLGGAGARPPRS